MKSATVSPANRSGCDELAHLARALEQERTAASAARSARDPGRSRAETDWHPGPRAAPCPRVRSPAGARDWSCPRRSGLRPRCSGSRSGSVDHASCGASAITLTLLTSTPAQQIGARARGPAPRASGAISASGTSTKARSSMRGCGIVSPARASSARRRAGCRGRACAARWESRARGHARARSRAAHRAARAAQARSRLPPRH